MKKYITMFSLTLILVAYFSYVIGYIRGDHSDDLNYMKRCSSLNRLNPVSVEICRNRLDSIKSNLES